MATRERQMIADYEDKKVVEYLKPEGKYLVRFGHGLGDTIMFIPCYEKLKAEHPECQIDLYVESGQEEIFDSVPDKDAPEYDEIFHLDFPMAIGGELTKPAKCCVDELGIEPITALAELPDKPSPLVGVHFHGTALPDSVGCPEPVAQQIWEEILDAGKIPIECHFEHMFHNPVNKKYWFVSSHVRNCTANLHNLIGLIQHLGAFVGVASGPWVTAMSIMPERTMYLEKGHAVETYIEGDDAASVNVTTYPSGSVKQWLDGLEW